MEGKEIEIDYTRRAQQHHKSKAKQSNSLSFLSLFISLS